MASVEEQVRVIAAPVAARHCAHLYDVEFGSGVLRVSIDCSEGGIDVDTIGVISQDLSRALDDADPVPGRYMLEVTSPGVERKLRYPEHFVAQIGRLINVKISSSVESLHLPRRFDAQVVDADEEAVTLQPKGDADTGAVIQLPYRDIESARSTFDWDQAFGKASDSAEDNEAVEPHEGRTRTTNKKASAR